MIVDDCDLTVDVFLEHQGIENNFTDDELLYLGVLLKQRNYSHVVNVIRQGDIQAAYLREVTPMIDGTMSFDLPGNVIPMWLYPTAASAALFHRGQELGPTTRLMTVSIAGFADAARTMNAQNQLPPKPQADYTEVHRIANQGSQGQLPSNRQALNDNLTSRGFVNRGQTQGGYVEYAHSDGTRVWVRPNGEVITVRREWLSDGSRKINVRYQWDGTPVPNGGHNTGEFVEPISDGSFIPDIR